MQDKGIQDNTLGYRFDNKNDYSRQKYMTDVRETNSKGFLYKEEYFPQQLPPALPPRQNTI